MRLARVAAALTVLWMVGAASTGVAFAHEEIESSVPEHKAQLDDPISEVTVNFGEPVGNVELALIGPDDRAVPGSITKLSDTSVRLDFDELTQQGEYIVRYLAEEEGHLVAGATTFVYGSPAAAGAGATTWIVFGAVAAIILAIGLGVTLRRSRRPDVVAEAA